MADALTVAPHARRSRIRNVVLIVRALRNLVTGFAHLRAAGPCVTVFGSARTPESHPYYALGCEIGRRLSEVGFTVMTGGGPGLMEAANRGARQAGGASIACNIELPIEQTPNRFVDRCVTCRHFFVRKVLMFRYSYGFVVLPGGFGTIDELFEALTLIQTGKIEQFPIVLIGVDYWNPLLTFIEVMARERMVDVADRDLFIVTDDVREAVAHIEQRAVDRLGLQRGADAKSRTFADPAKAASPSITAARF
jgi:uncharacterized protein (TIGR00730 family)